jgi:hypothetical protein
MALEDLQSKHGPFNKKGQPGTGAIIDPLAFEGKGGVENVKSKYGTTEKNGVPPTGPDPLGNRPPEKIAGV